MGGRRMKWEDLPEDGSVAEIRAAECRKDAVWAASEVAAFNRVSDAYILEE